MCEGHGGVDALLQGDGKPRRMGPATDARDEHVAGVALRALQQRGERVLCRGMHDRHAGATDEGEGQARTRAAHGESKRSVRRLVQEGLQIEGERGAREAWIALLRGGVLMMMMRVEVPAQRGQQADSEEPHSAGRG